VQSEQIVFQSVLTPIEACQWVCLWQLSLKPSR